MAAAKTMTQVGVNLPPDVVARIDAIGAELGLSRSAVVRMLVTAGLTTTHPEPGVWSYEAD